MDDIGDCIEQISILTSLVCRLFLRHKPAHPHPGSDFILIRGQTLFLVSKTARKNQEQSLTPSPSRHHPHRHHPQKSDTTPIPPQEPRTKSDIIPSRTHRSEGLNKKNQEQRLTPSLGKQRLTPSLGGSAGASRG